MGEFCKTLSFAIINRIGMINGSVMHVRKIDRRLSVGPNIRETIIRAIMARETTLRIAAIKLAEKCKNVNTFTRSFRNKKTAANPRRFQIID